MKPILFVTFLLLSSCSGQTRFGGMAESKSAETTAKELPTESQNSVATHVKEEQKKSEITKEEKKVVPEPDPYAGINLWYDASEADKISSAPDGERLAIQLVQNKAPFVFNATQTITQNMPTIVKDSLKSYFNFERAQAQDLYIENKSEFRTMFDPGKKWTIQFWMKPSAVASANDWTVIFDKPFTSHIAPFYQIQIAYHTDKGTVRPVITCDTTCSDLSAPVSPSKWNHVAWTVDLSSSVFKLYVDGRLASTSVQPLKGIYRNYDTGAAIGGLYGHRTPVYNFDGQLQNFEIFDEALSAERVSTIFEIEKKNLGL